MTIRASKLNDLLSCHHMTNGSVHVPVSDIAPVECIKSGLTGQSTCLQNLRTAQFFMKRGKVPLFCTFWALALTVLQSASEDDP